MSSVTLDDHVHLVASGRLGLGMSDDHDCNVYLLADGEDAVLVDAGCGLDVDALVERIRVLAMPPVSRILLTHAHADHAAGAGALAARLQASGLALPVHALAGAPGQDLPALYARADLVVFARLPSVAADLEVPFRLLEAMAHGCAVLASDVAGHRELVHHRDTGMLFQAGRADALATALLRLLAEPSRLAELGRAARAFVATQRSWDCAMASYAPVYERLCARAP
jgi:glycosyltransferase involved in cell wall biosynthesis